MMMYSGKCFLDNIFDTKKVDPSVTSVWSYYPESWANIPELQCLMEFIPKFYPNVKKIELTTHSVYIIQNVESKYIRIWDKHLAVSVDTSVNDHLQHHSPAPEALKGLHVLKPAS